MQIRYILEPRKGKCVKEYGSLPFARNLTYKYERKINWYCH